MGIMKPDGTTSWLEVTDTNTISRTVVLNDIGLYTIKISARNMPEGTGFVVERYYYTIRVY